MKGLFVFCGVIFVSATLFYVLAEQKSMLVKVNRPERVPFLLDQLKQLKIPTGFAISVFASNLGKPRMIAVAEDGSIYVSRPEQSDVIVLRDTNGDGKSEEPKTIIGNLPNVHGITIYKNQLCRLQSPVMTQTFG